MLEPTGWRAEQQTQAGVPSPCSLLVDAAVEAVQPPAALLAGRQRPQQGISRSLLEASCCSSRGPAARGPPNMEQTVARQQVRQVQTGPPQKVCAAPVATIAQQVWLLQAAASSRASSLRQGSAL